MKISAITRYLESLAAPVLQESYDNAGLITGNPSWECTGILVALDATEPVIREAREKGCNLVLAHHPIVFGGLKKLNGKNYVEQTVIRAIKDDIAIYAIHTNLDNVAEGVNGRMADKLGLTNKKILAPKENTLCKLYTFVPEAHAEKLRTALFEAGAGKIGNYDECSFGTAGNGTFRAGENSNPFVGEIGKRHYEAEIKLEVIFPAYLQAQIVQALHTSHPYEEVAYDIVSLLNRHPGIGSGMLGEWPEAISETAFLQKIQAVFGTPVIRHSPLTGRTIKKVAICGGAGSFLISKALGAGADAYITADLKYHEFFDANDRLLLADPGHFETEQYTIGLLQEVLAKKFPTFAVLKTEVETNPVRYFSNT